MKLISRLVVRKIFHISSSSSGPYPLKFWEIRPITDKLKIIKAQEKERKERSLHSMPTER